MRNLIRLLFTGCTIFFNTNTQAQAPVISSFSPTSAGANSYVTITGENFVNITEVKFGGIPAAAFYVSPPNNIYAQVGNGASGDITVTSSSGTVAASGFVFVPAPAITGFSPATGGLGTVVSITGANLANANFVYFGNVAAQSFTVVSDTLIRAVVSTGATGYIAVMNPVTNGAYSTSIFTHTGPVIHSFTPVSGPAGTTITIKGINFTGANNVTIGGIPVTSFTVVSDSSISAVTAPGSADFIKVATPQGLDSMGRFNKANIISFNPVQGQTGDTISIMGYNFTTTTGVSFGNIPAASFILSGDTLIKAVVGSGEFGAITVTTTSFGTVTRSYFYYVPASPQVRSISPVIGGPGTIITIKGKNFTTATAVNIGGTAAASYTIVADSVITAVVGTGSTGSVSITNPFGTSPGAQVFTYTTNPVILSLTPPSGAIGTVVDIAGVNFAEDITGNTIYFGPVAGIITAASTNHIRVTVPGGADNTALTLITGGKVVSAKKAFMVTFAGDTAFTANSFAAKIDSTAGYLTYGTAAGDFDGDGKPDIAIANYGDDNIGVYKNTSVNGSVAFAARQLFASSTGPKKVVTGDVDGDGKLDMAVGSQSGISVFRNTSTTGNISFAPAYTTSTGPGNQSIAMADFDGDGRPDLVTPNSDNFTTTLFRNTSTEGLLSFSGYDLGGAHPLSIAATDLNNDGKPDILVVNAADASIPAGWLYLYKNTSTGAGSFTFQLSTYYFYPNNISDISVGDLDGDGKPDIAVTDNDNARLYIARNTSATDITFDPFISLPSISRSASVSIADLNGDKKPELVVSNSNDQSSVYKNNSIPGVFSFSPYVTYNTGLASCFTDVTGDGKPDMICAGVFNPIISVLKNQVGPGTKTLCPSISNTTIYSNITGSTYQWQADTGSGFVNIVNNSNYSGVSTASLQLNSIPSSWYGYKYRSVVNGVTYSDVFELRVSNTWTGAVNSQWENPANWSCGTVPDSFTDVVINSGSIVVNSDITTRSLIIQPGVSLIVNSGYTLTVLR